MRSAWVIKKLNARELASGGLVIGGAIRVCEFLGEHAFRGGNDEAGDLGASFREHFLFLELDGFLRLGDEAGGFLDRFFLLFVGKFFGGFLSLCDDGLGFLLGFFERDFGLLLRGREPIFHLFGIFEAGVDLARTFIHRSDGGLDAFPIKNDEEDAKADRLDDDVFPLEAEFLDDAGFGSDGVGRMGSGRGGFNDSEKQRVQHGG